MPEKPKAAKKKSPASPVKAAPAKSNSRSKTAKPKAAQRKSAFYVRPSRTTAILTAKPKDSPDSREFASFSEARAAAIDELVSAIEAAERQLLSLKRATRYEELPANGTSK